MNDFHNPNDYWMQTLYNEQKDIDPDEAMRMGCLHVVCFIAMMFVGLLLCALLGSCSPKVIENVVTRTDTCFIQKMQRDSVYMHDSIYVHEWTAGDTVRITTDRWHVKWKEKIIRDTAYVSRHDTVRVTKIEQVAKPLSQWQQMRLWLANLVLVALAAIVCITLARWWLKRKLL